MHLILHIFYGQNSPAGVGWKIQHYFLLYPAACIQLFESENERKIFHLFGSFQLPYDIHMWGVVAHAVINEIRNQRSFNDGPIPSRVQNFKSSQVSWSMISKEAWKEGLFLHLCTRKVSPETEVLIFQGIWPPLGHQKTFGISYPIKSLGKLIEEDHWYAKALHQKELSPRLRSTQYHLSAILQQSEIWMEST